jgi:hypothetical protein
MLTKIYKFVNGETMIADWDSTDNPDPANSDVTFVRRPLKMTFTQQGIALQMWCPSDMDKPVAVATAHILTESVCIDQLAAEYRSKFQPQIVSPEPPKLIVPGQP